jgi:hypothetical protein
MSKSYLKDFLLRNYKHIIVIIAPILYFLTVCPTIGSADAAILTDRMAQLWFNSKVNAHNLANLFGYLFSKIPFGDLAYRVNLMSAFFGSLSAVLFYFLTWRITKHYWVTVLAFAFITVSHSHWWHSTIVECYAINSVLLLLVAHCYLSFMKERKLRFIYLAFFLSGLAIFNHVQNGVLLLSSAAFTIFYYKEITREQGQSFIKVTLISALFYIIGLVPYIIVFVRDLIHYNWEFWKVLLRAVADDFGGMMFNYSALSIGYQGWQYLNQFPSVFLPISAFGMGYAISVKHPHRRFFVALLAFAFLPMIVFFSGYPVWDLYAFMLPAYVITALCGAVGLKVIFNWLIKQYAFHKGSKKGLIYKTTFYVFILLCVFGVAFPPYFYSKISHWGENPYGLFSQYTNLEFENIYDRIEYNSDPNKCDYRDLDEFINLLLDKLPRNAVYLDNGSRTYRHIRLYYRKYENRADKGRRDIRLIFLDVFGFGWGTTPNAIVNNIKRGKYDLNNFFLSSPQRPNEKVIELLNREKYIFIPYKLDNDHWIYKLVVRYDDSKYEDYRHIDLYDMRFGENIGTLGENIKKKFDADDNVMIRLYYAKSPHKEPVEALFKWYSPSGDLLGEVKKDILQDSRTMYVSLSENNKLMAKGHHSIKLFIDGVELFERSFAVK